MQINICSYLIILIIMYPAAAHVQVELAQSWYDFNQDLLKSTKSICTCPPLTFVYVTPKDQHLLVHGGWDGHDELKTQRPIFALICYTIQSHTLQGDCNARR